MESLIVLDRRHPPTKNARDAPVGKQQGAADCCCQSTEQEPSHRRGSPMLGNRSSHADADARITRRDDRGCLGPVSRLPPLAKPLSSRSQVGTAIASSGDVSPRAEPDDRWGANWSGRVRPPEPESNRPGPGAGRSRLVRCAIASVRAGARNGCERAHRFHGGSLIECVSPPPPNASPGPF